MAATRLSAVTITWASICGSILPAATETHDDLLIIAISVIASFHLASHVRTLITLLKQPTSLWLSDEVRLKLLQ